MTKKVVYYRQDKGVNFYGLGQGCVVWPINHPDSHLVSNEGPAHTSAVQNYDPDTGIFETMNTRYEPKEYNV
jgi:hypothetical protein